MSQSRSDCLAAEFEGLPPLPPPLDALVGEAKRQNLWACCPPKVSALHYDNDDSVLMQLAGTKRFTLVDPQPLHGLTTYPSVQRVVRLERLGPGRYAPEPSAAAREREGEGAAPVTAKHFPLVNVSRPDLARHPLFRFARVTTVEVPAGSALLLPAYWYHEVESFAEPGELNVAVNYWFEKEQRAGTALGGALPGSMHRILRAKLRRDCTL